MITTLNNYQSIENSILKDIAENNWKNFSDQIQNLSNSQKSSLLSSDLYINYIDETINSSCSGKTIKAISLYLNGEFVENSFEINFHKTQKKALERGVKIERVFVCSESRMYDLQSTQFWDDHLRLFNSKFADESDIKSRGIAITAGFIMIDDVIFLDNHDTRKELGGIVSTNTLEIERAKQTYTTIERHSQLISERFK